MEKNFRLLFALFLTINVNVFSQQLHDFTQYPSVLFHINPAYTGTKGTLDARLSYRKQWTGFSGAPTTQFVGMHGRLWKGRIGLGSSLYKDELGPIRTFDYGFSAAGHFHFPDVEFSAGISVRFNKLTLNTSDITTHWEGDPAVTQAGSILAKSKNALAGMMLYNDRFHFGLGVMNIIGTKIPVGGATIKSKQHYFLTFGYNFHGHPYYVWENNLMAEYVDGLPMTINYNLRMHYREKLSVGAGWRLRDAVYLQAGWVLFRSVQIAYSYDIGISKLKKAHNGTHEVTLAYRYDYEKKKGKYNNFNTFQKQRYNIF
jgi:type IX secretion system PorP/SprF family membrane protein